MPLSINVGLSRKTSAHFQSSGVSINVTAELDQALLAKPDDLQKQIGELYAQAEHALTQQADSMVLPEPPPPRNPQYDRGRGYDQRRDSSYQDHRYPGRGYDNRGNGGYDNGGRRSSNGGPPPMTASQRGAINSISNRLGIDPRLEARDIVGCELDDLSVPQASDLIDHLKRLQQPSGRRR